MKSSNPGHSAQVVAEDALRVAAWRRLWRLLLQPTGNLPDQHEAAPDHGTAGEEVQRDRVRAPR